MSVRALLTTSALLLQLLLATSSPVEQSTCRVIWVFKLPCTDPASALANQVRAWSTKNCPDSQEKCMYEIIRESVNSLEIKHTSPSTHAVTIINFELSPPAAPQFCKMKGLSTTKSKNTTNPNDYCLLYNLIEGSGLTETQGYREITNDKICPAKQSATCHT